MSKKSDNKITVTKSGIGFTGVLTIVFIVLKLCGVINWSWIWVLSPMIISVSLSILIIAVCVIIWLVCTILSLILK